MTNATDDVQWSAKEIAVAVPLLASSLALAWQVGKMMPFGGFQFFSLADHLVSALRALPVALFASAWVGFGLAAIANAKRRVGHRRLRVLILVVAASLASIGAAYYSDFPLAGFVALQSLVAFVILNAVFGWVPWSSALGSLIAFLSATTLAATTAHMVSTDTIKDLRKKKADHLLSIVELKNGQSKQALIVMNGERGILVFDPMTELVSFNRADDIKAVWWEPSQRRSAQE